MRAKVEASAAIRSNLVTAFRVSGVVPVFRWSTISWRRRWISLMLSFMCVVRRSLGSPSHLTLYLLPAPTKEYTPPLSSSWRTGNTADPRPTLCAKRSRTVVCEPECPANRITRCAECTESPGHPLEVAHLFAGRDFRVTALLPAYLHRRKLPLRPEPLLAAPRSPWHRASPFRAAAMMGTHRRSALASATRSRRTGSGCA